MLELMPSIVEVRSPFSSVQPHSLLLVFLVLSLRFPGLLPLLFPFPFLQNLRFSRSFATNFAFLSSPLVPPPFVPYHLIVDAKRWQDLGARRHSSECR